MGDLQDGNQRHIEAVATHDGPRALGLVWEQMRQQLIDYGNRPENRTHPAKVQERYSEASKIYQALKNHVERLIATNEVSPLVAKVFLENLHNIKQIGTPYYNELGRNREPQVLQLIQGKNPNYVQALERFLSKFDSRQVLEEGAFLHFNAPANPHIDHRVYIATRLGADPARLIEYVLGSLERSGTKNAIYFKVMEGLSAKLDNIVLYVNRENAQHVEHFLLDFIQTCPPDLLSPDALPVALPLARGISFAPEHRNVNRLLELMGATSASHTEIAGGLYRLSLELGYRDLKRRQVEIDSNALGAAAKPHFSQLLKLAGVNPDTLVPYRDQGALPPWAVRVQVASSK
jgi:hypothetical protein